MIEEPFASGNSIIHRLDPRLKIIFAAVFSFVVALSWEFPTLLMALVFSFLLTSVAKLKVSRVATRLAVVNGLILFFWALVPLTFKGEPLFYLGPLAVAREGVTLCARVTLKSNAILLTVISLIATMPIATVGHAMSRLHFPQKIVHLLLLTYRYIFVIEQEYRRLARSAKVRAFRPHTNVHAYRTYAYLIGMLFVRASERAKRVHQAMICRGFQGKFYCLYDFSISRLDWAFSIIMAGALFGLGILEWTRAV